jgi:hypothetical protein
MRGGEMLLFDVRDFFLLFLIRLHLIHLVFGFGAHKCRVITRVVGHLRGEIRQPLKNLQNTMQANTSEPSSCALIP